MSASSSSCMRISSAAIAGLSVLRLEHVAGEDPQEGEVALARITELVCRSTHIQDIDPTLWRALPNLEYVDLSKNKLKAFPKGLHQCTRLHTIVLDHNKIADTSSLEELNAHLTTRKRVLHHLSLNHNKITAIPNYVNHCTNLCLEGNQIEILPAFVAQWTHLRLLNLRHNPLALISPSVFFLTSLAVIVLDFVKYCSPAWQRQLQASEIIEIQALIKKRFGTSINECAKLIQDARAEPCDQENAMRKNDTATAEREDLANVIFRNVSQGKMTSLPLLPLYSMMVALSKSTFKLRALDRNKRSRLHLVVEDKNRGILRSLLMAGGNPNQLDDQNFSPLLYAVKNKSVELASDLLNFNADVDHGGGVYGSPLHVAVVNIDPLLTGLLLRHGADPNYADDDGHTPLHVIFSVFDGGGDRSIAVALFLLSKGANCNTKGRGGWAPLHLASRRNQQQAIKFVDDCLRIGSTYQNAPLAKAALFDLNIRGGPQGWTPLHLAAREGLAEALRLLLQAGADPTAENDVGRAPRHVCGGQFECHKVLHRAEKEWLWWKIVGRRPREVLSSIRRVSSSNESAVSTRRKVFHRSENTRRFACSVLGNMDDKLVDVNPLISELTRFMEAPEPPCIQLQVISADEEEPDMSLAPAINSRVCYSDTTSSSNLSVPHGMNLNLLHSPLSAFKEFLIFTRTLHGGWRQLNKPRAWESCSMTPLPTNERTASSTSPLAITSTPRLESSIMPVDDDEFSEAGLLPDHKLRPSDGLDPPLTARTHRIVESETRKKPPVNMPSVLSFGAPEQLEVPLMRSDIWKPISEEADSTLPVWLKRSKDEDLFDSCGRIAAPSAPVTRLNAILSDAWSSSEEIHDNQTLQYHFRLDQNTKTRTYTEVKAKFLQRWTGMQQYQTLRAMRDSQSTYLLKELNTALCIGDVPQGLVEDEIEPSQSYLLQPVYVSRRSSLMASDVVPRHRRGSRGGLPTLSLYSPYPMTLCLLYNNILVPPVMACVDDATKQLAPKPSTDTSVSLVQFILSLAHRNDQAALGQLFRRMSVEDLASVRATEVATNLQYLLEAALTNYCVTEPTLLLLARHIPFSSRFAHGNTALCLATKRRMLYLQRTLLMQGADPNGTNMDGDRPLHVAVHSRCKITLLSLLYHPNINIHLTNRAEGLTPLELAVKTGYLHGIGILLNRGAFLSLGTIANSRLRPERKERRLATLIDQSGRSGEMASFFLGNHYSPDVGSHTLGRLHEYIKKQHVGPERSFGLRVIPGKVLGPTIIVRSTPRASIDGGDKSVYRFELRRQSFKVSGDTVCQRSNNLNRLQPECSTRCWYPERHCAVCSAVCTLTQFAGPPPISARSSYQQPCMTECHNCSVPVCSSCAVGFQRIPAAAIPLLQDLDRTRADDQRSPVYFAVPAETATQKTHRVVALEPIDERSEADGSTPAELTPLGQALTNAPSSMFDALAAGCLEAVWLGGVLCLSNGLIGSAPLLASVEQLSGIVTGLRTVYKRVYRAMVRNCYNQSEMMNGKPTAVRKEGKSIGLCTPRMAQVRQQVYIPRLRSNVPAEKSTTHEYGINGLVHFVTDERLVAKGRTWHFLADTAETVTLCPFCAAFLSSVPCLLRRV